MPSIKKWVVLVALGSLVAGAKVAVPRGFKLKGDRVEVKGWPEEALGLGLFLGSGREPRKQEITFIPDLGFSGVIIGDRSTGGWGIDCVPQVGCMIDEESKADIFYQNTQFFSKKGNAALTIAKEVLVDDEVFHKVWTGASVPVSGDKWRYRDFSVLGLAPKSKFFSTLAQVYAIDHGILFRLTPKDDEPRLTRQYILQPVFNPVIPEETVELKVDFTGDDHWWLLQGSLQTSFKQHDVQGKIGVTLLTESVVSVADPQGYCQAVRAAVCPGSSPHQCTSDKIDRSKFPPLMVMLNGKTFVIDWKDYIDFNSENALVCNFGDLGHLKSINAVPLEAKVALGKRFFASHMLLLNPANERPASLWLVSSYAEPEPPKPERGWGYWILGLAALAIFAAFSLFRKTPRPRSDTDESMRYQAI